MTPWRQTIGLSEPLRAAQLMERAAPSAGATQEELRARYEAGLRDGEKGLREQLLRQRSEVLELQQGVLQALKGCLPQVRNECEGALVGVALEVARKLVAGLPISAEMVEAAVREALAQVDEGHAVVVLLHREDLDLLQRVNAPVLLSSVGGEQVRFESAPEVTRGGCLVRTRFGVLDARRETKFELLKKALQT